MACRVPNPAGRSHHNRGIFMSANARDGWIGVALDGTLAEYTEWKGADHILWTTKNRHLKHCDA